MLIDTKTLLNTARENSFAIGAFNVYNLEGAKAVIEAAEELKSPVMLQLLPSALEIGNSALIALCMELARNSTIPASVHLDHCSDKNTIEYVVKAGLTSIMADGSNLSFEKNLLFTQEICSLVASMNGCVEAELGKLSGEEDGLAISAQEEKLTNPEEAEEFAKRTNLTAMAVCIGNIHGKYNRIPELDFKRLACIRERVTIPLVLHGTSGLPDKLVRTSIEHGICKFNVNTEVRSCYLETMAKSFANSSRIELVSLMQKVIEAMKEPVRSKINLFCSANKAQFFNS